MGWPATVLCLLTGRLNHGPSNAVSRDSSALERYGVELDGQCFVKSSNQQETYRRVST